MKASAAKTPKASGSATSSSKPSTSARQASSKKIDAALVSNVCRSAATAIGSDLDNKLLGGVSVRSMAEQMGRMLAKDYKVVNHKALAATMVCMADDSLLRDEARMRQLGLSALSPAQMEAIQLYQQLLSDTASDYEVVAALTKEDAANLASHTKVALLTWMVAVAAKLAGVKPGRVARLPGGKYNAGDMSAQEKKLRVGTLHILAAKLVKGGKLGQDEHACKKLLADLATISSKI